MANLETSQDQEFHIRYLKSRLVKCKSNPKINAEQIKILQKILSIAEVATDYNDYILKLGQAHDFFPLAQAEQIDRFRSLEDFYKSIEFKEYVISNQAKREAAETAKDYSDLASKVPQGYGSGFQNETTAQARLNSIASLLVYLIHYSCLGDEKERASLMHTIVGEWDKILSTDPEFSFASLMEKPYSFLHPFDEKKIQHLEKVFQENR